MRVVHKYPVDIDDYVTAQMPVGAEVIHVAEQHGRLCLWASVDPTLTLEERRFRIAGTGHHIRGAIGSHIGSVLLAGGDLVFHVFNA